ncbi:MAG: AAA family ATPase [bacterium]|nr:AAA family ATPase [bacterium]
MGRIVIKSLKYEGDKYYYFNDKFKKGLNVVEGDNGNGKSTFTYLIVYALGMEVKYFDSKEKENITVITTDNNNYVALEVEIGNQVYVLKRAIGDNFINIYNPKTEEYLILNITRNGYLYEKEGKTFSDWICNKLNIDIVQMEQYNQRHYLNFEDLMRYVYYEQGNNRTIIGEFGISSKNYVRNSELMKRAIFEVLMMSFMPEYYQVYNEIRNIQKEIEDKKNEIKSIQIIKDKIVVNIDVSEENILMSLEKCKKERQRLVSIRDEIQEEDSPLGEGIQESLLELQKKLIEYTYIISSYDDKVNSAESNLSKSKIVKKDILSEIEMLQKILFTASYIDIIAEDRCPFCNEKVDLSNKRCICGSDKYLDFSRFIYSDKEYKSMIKSKVKGLQTVERSISSYEEDIKRFKERIEVAYRQKEETINTIKSIVNSVGNNRYTSIDEISNNIIRLNEEIRNIELINEYYKKISEEQSEINKKSTELQKKKSRLEALEEEKEKILDENIGMFQEIYSKYLSDFYNDQNYNGLKLDRNYVPIIPGYREQSFSVPKRVFYFLTFLKMSLNDEIKINYPRFLLMDTMKNGGIEIQDLIRLQRYLLEFNEDCQLIVTCGYDEYTNDLDPYRIQYLSDNGMLFKVKNENE